MKPIVLILILTAILVCPVTAIIMSCTGIGSCTMNQTFNLTANMTENMTAGPPGANGANGADGAAATIAVNATFTGSNSTPASVTNIGTTAAALFDFIIPEGLTGAVGATGAENMTMNLTANMTGNMTMNQTMLDESVYPFLNGSRILTGIWNFGGYNISGVGNPVVSTDAATWDWVLSQITSALAPYDTIANQSTVNASIQSLIVSVNNTQVANVSANNASMKSYVDTAISGIGFDDSIYYWANTSRALTGNYIRRDVNDGDLYIYGGNDSLPASARIILMGGSRPTLAGNFYIQVPNATGGALNSVIGITGMTDTPVVNLYNHKIVSLADPSAAQDAATKAYSDALNTSMRNNVSANFVPMVSNKTPPINLGSGTADSTTYLRGDQTWASPAGGSDPTAKSTTLLFSDFYDPGVDNALPGLAGLAISSGTAAVVATTANHPGVIYMRDSTTANGGYKYGCVGTQLIGGGETFEVVFQPVGVRNTQHTQMGWSDTAAAGTLPVDGVYFNITGTGAAITLRGNTSSNSVRSGTATTYAPTTATWYRGTIAVNAAGTLVTYTLYNEAGASVWTDTVATNIPTGAGRDTSPCLIVSQLTTDAAADIVRLDYVKWGTTRTLTR